MSGQPRPAAALRPAAPADVDAIATVWHAGWIDGHRGHVPPAIEAHRRRDDFRRRVRGRLPTTTVACVDGVVVGFVTVHDDELDQLYVAASARGTGVADALLDHAEAVIATDHVVAWLAVVAGNARARRFYARRGWRDAGAIDHPAEIDGGSFIVPSRRYDKRVRTT